MSDCQEEKGFRVEYKYTNSLGEVQTSSVMVYACDAAAAQVKALDQLYVSGEQNIQIVRVY